MVEKTEENKAQSCEENVNVVKSPTCHRQGEEDHTQQPHFKKKLENFLKQENN